MSKNLNFVGNNEPARPMVQQQRKVKKNINYNDDSEQSDYDYAGGGNSGYMGGNSVSKSLHKVQSTPHMKMQIHNYQY